MKNLYLIHTYTSKKKRIILNDLSLYKKAKVFELVGKEAHFLALFSTVLSQAAGGGGAAPIYV
jgi:catalase